MNFTVLKNMALKADPYMYVSVAALMEIGVACRIISM
jgi:hypothetical protein